MSKVFIFLLNNAVILSVFVFTVALFTQNVSGEKLNKYIQYYEPLNYDARLLHSQHNRVKRSLYANPISLKFYSHGRLFMLILSPDRSVFNEHSSLLWHNGKIDRGMGLSHIYSGYVQGYKDSHVHGSIIDGVFIGRIDLPDESYYVEKSIFFFKEPSFHSIIYADKDVIDDPRDENDDEDIYIRSKRSINNNNNNKSNIKGNDHPHHHRRHHHHHQADCGMSHKDVHAWMESVQKSAVPTLKPLAAPASLFDRDHESEKETYHTYKNMYSFEANNKHRMKRGLSSGQRQCSLYLQSDPTLWAYFSTLMPENKIKDEITALLANHVDALNSIYKSTLFSYNGMGPFYGFNFVVHRVQINSTYLCGPNGTNPTSGFCKNNLDASNFLNEQSLTNHSDYCLAFTFSYRQFTQGTIGLAWVAQLGSSGGICEKYKQYTEGNQQVYKSLNTGIVTLCNYNNRVPVKVSQITFAHEVGHNFGSLHDSGPTCIPLLANPSDKRGNFLMYASATSGLQENNNKFSSCSINNITLILNQILSSSDKNVNCFQEKEGAFCGNGIVENDTSKNVTEQCDCGFENDCHDNCCFPRTISDSSPNADKACTLRENANCSKSQGPCCNDKTCNFVEAVTNQTCRRATDCTEQAYCNGKQAQCPPSPKKPDGDPCNENTRMCFKGECSQSICNKISWTECSLQAPAGDKSFDRGLLCFVSCLNPRTNSCISTGSKDLLQQPANQQLYNLVTNLTSSSSIFGIRLPAGTPCENFLGYCDVFYKCRPVNEDGPLLQLKNLLLNEKTINDIRQWVTEYWWVVLLAGVGAIVFMALFIKLCAVHTPSSNPKLKKARQLSLRRKRRQQADMKMGVSSISAGHHDVLRTGASGEPSNLSGVGSRMGGARSSAGRAAGRTKSVQNV